MIRPLLSFLVALATLPALAQPIPVIGGLASPIGLEADADGTLWVGERGTGADDGQITVVTPDGTPHPFLTGIPSVIGVEDLESISHLALAGDAVWFTWTHEGALEGHLVRVSRAGWVPGDTPKTMADVDLDVDVATYSLGNGAASSNPYGIAPAPDGTVYLTDAGGNTLLHYDPVADALSTVAFFPDIPNPTPIGPPFTNTVPTGVVWNDGRLYVSTLTGFPFVDGQARVLGVEPDGVWYAHESGLTTLTDVAVDPRDGAMAATRFALFRFDPPPPGFVFGTGNATHLGDGSVLADGLPFATSADYGPDGALYLTTIIGTVFRLDAPAAALDTELLSSHRVDAPAEADSPLFTEMDVTNTTDAPMDVTAWAVAEVVETGWRGVVNGGKAATLAPGETRRVRFRQRVKASDGDRTVAYTLFAGDMAAGDPVAGDGALAQETVVIRQEGGVEIAGTSASGVASKGWTLPLLDDGAEWAGGAPEAGGLALAAQPNPARGTVALSFALNAEADVRLALHDALGREVRVLAEGVRPAGPHTVRVDVAGLAPGVYVARLATPTGATTQRLTVVR